MGKAERLAVGSILVGAVVLALKSAAFQLTGSAALFSDAAESVVNVVAAVVAFFALRLAAKPADANHLYGHHKAEFISAVVEGVLIVLAALAILNHAWDAYLHPEPLDAPVLGMALNAGSTALNAAWGMVMIRSGRRLRSPAVVADGKHLMSDVVTSVGVLVGVGMVVATGLIWLDPLLAAATAVYILGSGYFLIRDSLGGLMDAAPPGETIERIRRIVGQHAVGAIEAHDLRIRHAGTRSFLEFHLVVPQTMTVADAHTICDRVEAALKAEMEEMIITIHVEPESKAKHHGVIVI